MVLWGVGQVAPLTRMHREELTWLGEADYPNAFPVFKGMAVFPGDAHVCRLSRHSLPNDTARDRPRYSSRLIRESLLEIYRAGGVRQGDAVEPTFVLHAAAVIIDPFP